MRRVAGVLALGALAVAGCSTDDDTNNPPDGARTSVVVVGDSLAVEAMAFLPGLLPDRSIVDDTFGGTAPCDWLAEDLGITSDAVTLISFVGNSGTPCMAVNGAQLDGDALIEKYREDVGALIDRAVELDSHVVLIGQPAYGVPEGAEKVERLNELYREFAGDRDGVSFVDAGAEVESENGEFAATLPCFEGEEGCAADGSIVVRSDDALHFCPGTYIQPCGTYSAGAFRFAAGMAPAAVDPAAFEE